MQSAHAAATDDRRSRKPSASPRRNNAERGKKRLTVSLSDKTMVHINALKDLTDADSDSEVIRNAVRLQLVLLKAHHDGKQLFLKEGEQLIAVQLFADAG